ncbi:hypothetical protein [Rhodococcus globerulus]|uniref:Uncharacterized protein n=1 Tax=Rhodococcus globerulus TaxID=33008 RepID=A0ABU4C544_RHOGO|nr:hypothetical protein [Rhodococcus globerulus]MDV6271634.1 hypothetical protein [Rhodococcus globerulus]
MGPTVTWCSDSARALMRGGYRILRCPLNRIDRYVVPVFVAEDAPANLAYQRFLIGCDRIAAQALDDRSAAAHAVRVDRRSAVIRYAIARHRHEIQRETDALLAGHRARFLRSQRLHKTRRDKTRRDKP